MACAVTYRRRSRRDGDTGRASRRNNKRAMRNGGGGAGRVREEFIAAARRVGRAQFRALLRDGRHEALPSARTRKHFEAATDPCRRVQPEPDPAQTAGCGHATGAEKPCWASVFPTFVLPAVPGEGRFADPDALSRRWPAKGTIVPLPHTGSPPAILELFYHGLLT